VLAELGYDAGGWLMPGVEISGSPAEIVRQEFFPDGSQLLTDGLNATFMPGGSLIRTLSHLKRPALFLPSVASIVLIVRSAPAGGHTNE